MITSLTILFTNSSNQAFTHSIAPKTALVKITNDLLMAADAGLLTILILLDLSAAFDSISHTILIDRLASLVIFDTPLD